MMSAHAHRFLPALLLLAVLAGLQPAAVRAADTSAGPDTVALVNGVPLTRDLLEVFALAAMGQRVADLPEPQRAGLLDALIRAEIIAQQAEKLGLSAKNELDIPDATAAQIAFGRLQALNQVVFETFEREHQPEDQELQAEYQRQIALLPSKQYHAHHILVSSRPKAEDLIRQLKSGAHFEALAMSDSLDPSGHNGGDLGWFSLTSMAEPFAKALKTMKSGELLAQPVQTSYGWHVIRLDETRELAPPSFDSLRDKLAATARAQKLQSYVADLLKGAEVQKFN
jgi:peptidyl-prolyl cis-trans isomerase C